MEHYGGAQATISARLPADRNLHLHIFYRTPDSFHLTIAISFPIRNQTGSSTYRAMFSPG